MANREHGTMKALRKMQAARGLSMEPAHVPAIGPTDVLVRVKAASIAGRICTFMDGIGGRRGESSRR